MESSDFSHALPVSVNALVPTLSPPLHVTVPILVCLSSVTLCLNIYFLRTPLECHSYLPPQQSITGSMIHCFRDHWTTKWNSYTTYVVIFQSSPSTSTNCHKLRDQACDDIDMEEERARPRPQKASTSQTGEDNIPDAKDKGLQTEL